MLIEQLKADMVSSMKERNEFKTSTLRMLISEIKNREIDLKAQGKELDDSEVLTVLTREKKKRQESKDIYEKSNRPDLAEKEANEILLLDTYLPKQMDKSELIAFIESEVNAMPENERNFNSAVKIVMPKLKGKADSKEVVDILKSKFN